MKKRTVNHIQDAGHGWVSVSHDDIRDLNLARNISIASHINGTRVFLEEDRDALVFLEAAEKAGWVVTVKGKLTDSDHCYIRRLASYNSEYLSKVLAVGRWIKSGDVVYKVTNETRNSFHICMPFTSVRWSIPKSNPFYYFDSFLPDNYAPQQAAL